MEEFFDKIYLEYGLLVLSLIIAVITQWRRIIKIEDRLFKAFEQNTKVITRLVERLGEHDDDKDDRSV